jgi:phosphoglycerate dehydrogenase-like enzyme
MFKVGISRDLLDASGKPIFGTEALSVLGTNPMIEWEYTPELVTEITPDMAARYDGLHINLAKVTRRSLSRDDCRLKIIARNGVGYDSVDLTALDQHGVILTNTPMAVRRPVAVATLTMIFALAGRLFQKDRLVRQGRWEARNNAMGMGLTKRTLGLVGAGGIGQEIMRLARPFFSQMLAADPYADATSVRSLGCELVSLEQLLGTADFIVVCCQLTPETRHLINAARISMMKPSAYLINMARGPVLDEAALIVALTAKTIAGAGLDVFEQEPTPISNPLLRMDNVVLTPHALCWTDECFHDIAASALQSIVDVSLGHRPQNVVKN